MHFILKGEGYLPAFKNCLKENKIKILSSEGLAHRTISRFDARLHFTR
jgi:hypothetical protein